MKNWNSPREALGYFYGATKGDGCLTDRKIIFFNTSRPTVERFLNSIKKCEKAGLFKRKNKKYKTDEIPIKKIKPRGKNKKTGFRVTYCSVNALKKLKEFSPLKKSSRVKKEVIRGLFDSEGCIIWKEEKSWKALIFTNTDKDIISLYCSLLNDFDVGYYKGFNDCNSEWSVICGSWDAVFFFRDKVGFTLEKHKNKVKILSDYFEERGWKRELIDKDKLFKMVNNGYSDIEIAEEMEFARGSIGRVRRELGLKPNIKHKSRRLDRDKIKNMLDKGKTDKEISGELDCHKRSISNIRYKLGIPRNK